MIVVADATPLIALAKINKLDILADLFDRVILPQSVYDEVVTQAADKAGSADIKKADFFDIRSASDQSKVRYLLATLDAGESEALVLAEELAADLVLLDEKKARGIAEKIGLHYTGTIGLLLAAKKKGRVKSLRPLLDELRAKSFRLGETLYLQILDIAGE